jgi:hypothetical protein
MGKSVREYTVDLNPCVVPERPQGPANGNATLPLSDHGITKMQTSRWQAKEVLKKIQGNRLTCF